MNTTPYIALAVIALILAFLIFYKRPKKKTQLPENFNQILNDHVAFYRKLSEDRKPDFEKRITDFLNHVKIEGVGITITDLDRLLVAASAVIPSFGYKNWGYLFLNNVLLYPASFNKSEFLAHGTERDTLGMVGNGPLQNVMILSRPALHSGFHSPPSMRNTGIHEFVHLLDKADGYVDGLPEVLTNRKTNDKWNELMKENMKFIIENQSNIDSYASYNQAEFFAVVSEYFFNMPEDFKQRHPELYEIMCKIFNQHPA